MNPRSLAALSLACLAVACGDTAPASSSATASGRAATTMKPPVAPSSTASAVVSAQPSASAGAAPEKIAAQHVLVSYQGAKGTKGITRSKADAKKLADEIRAKAVAGTDFSELATKHSEDAGSKDRLGSVGTFRHPDMTKRFSDAAFALEVGAISEVVETEFGFHIIKRNQ